MGSSVNEILINRSLARRCPDLNREILSETWSQAKRSTGLCHSGSFVIYPICRCGDQKASASVDAMAAIYSRDR